MTASWPELSPSPILQLLETVQPMHKKIAKVCLSNKPENLASCQKDQGHLPFSSFFAGTDGCAVNNPLLVEGWLPKNGSFFKASNQTWTNLGTIFTWNKPTSRLFRASRMERMRQQSQRWDAQWSLVTHGNRLDLYCFTEKIQTFATPHPIP